MIRRFVGETLGRTLNIVEETRESRRAASISWGTLLKKHMTFDFVWYAKLDSCLFQSPENFHFWALLMEVYLPLPASILKLRAGTLMVVLGVGCQLIDIAMARSLDWYPRSSGKYQIFLDDGLLISLLLQYTYSSCIIYKSMDVLRGTSKAVTRCWSKAGLPEGQANGTHFLI